jgi:TusA-related sulfurtransferase
MPRSPASSSPPTAPSPGDGEVLDLAGEVCPFTFVRTRLALEALPIGARLRVVVDHPPARDNVPRSAIAWGQEVIGVTDLGGRWLIEILKQVD